MTNKERILLHSDALSICEAIAENRTKRKELEDQLLTAQFDRDCPEYFKNFIINFNQSKMKQLDEERMNLHCEYSLTIAKLFNNEHTSAN